MTNLKIYCVFLGFLMIAGCSTTTKTPIAPPSKASTKAPEDPLTQIERAKPKAFPDAPQFVVECRLENQPFSISFQSKSGDLTKNDMQVSVLFEKTEVPINVDPAWYHAVDSATSIPSLCDGVPAFGIENTQQVMLVFNLDQKPAFPETTIVLIDLKSKRVLSKLERIGKLKAAETPRYTLIPAPNGFQVRLIRDPHLGTEDWKWLIVKKGHLTAKWMRTGKTRKGD